MGQARAKGIMPMQMAMDCWGFARIIYSSARRSLRVSVASSGTEILVGVSLEVSLEVSMGKRRAGMRGI